MTMIGKRKREIRVIARSEESLSSPMGQLHDQEIFRRYFESQFEPLPPASTVVDDGSEDGHAPNVSSDAVSLSDWEGLSGEDSTHPVEVIEYGKVKEITDSADDVQHAKIFMSAKPPALDDSIVIKTQKLELPSKEDVAEAINLKHDLTLQRLLKESHLLEISSGSTVVHTHRHKAIDLRMQSLGAKSSLFTQAKMPLSHRKGIIAKASQREAFRRKEAKQNGIVLEKEAKERSAKPLKRERGVGGPTVGKFKDGTLRLSKRDISDIQGPPRTQRVSRKRRK